MSLALAEMFDDCGDVIGRAVLRIGTRSLGNVGWRIATGSEGGAAIAPPKMPHLEFPALIVGGKFVYKYDKFARSRFLEVQLDAIVDGRMGHHVISLHRNGSDDCVRIAAMLAPAN